MPERSFSDFFSNAYDRWQPTPLAKSIPVLEGAKRAVALDAVTHVALGHPDFEHLKVGETQEGQGVILFLDIRGFTKLSLVLENDELLRILQALTEAAVRVVIQYGGHVIEFTGDGVMAAFGDASTQAASAAFAALHTTAALMKGVRSEVNPRLKRYDTEPIRTAMGMEFGDILWARIGALGTSQVKPISEATFLAGKLATGELTNAWEAKVGSALAEWIPDDFKERAEKYEFTLNKLRYSHDLFRFKWQEFGSAYQARPEELRKNLLRRKLTARLLKSPYLSALQVLTEAGYDVVFDDSTDCPHLSVELDRNRGLSVIITFESDSLQAVPKVFVRDGQRLEAVAVDASTWVKGGGDLARLISALRRGWS